MILLLLFCLLALPHCHSGTRKAKEEEHHHHHHHEEEEEEDEPIKYTSPEKLLSGNWTNKRHSHLTLHAKSNGTITGLYQTAAVSKLDPNRALPPAPISGTFQVTGDGLLIALDVPWQLENKTRVTQIKHSVHGKLFYEKPDKWAATWTLAHVSGPGALLDNVLTQEDRFKRM